MCYRKDHWIREGGIRIKMNVEEIVMTLINYYLLTSRSQHKSTLEYDVTIPNYLLYRNKYIYYNNNNSNNMYDC